jgi:hypothetical protein
MLGIKGDMARKGGHLHPDLIYIYINPLVLLCTKGKNKGVGVRQKGVGERDPEKEEEREKRGKKFRV